MGKFFPDYGSYGTGDPMLDHISGFKPKKYRDPTTGRDPFAPDSWVDYGAPAGGAGGAAATAPAAPAPQWESRLQEKPERVGTRGWAKKDKREEEKKRREALKNTTGKGRGPRAGGRGEGAGLSTGGLTTGRSLSGSEAKRKLGT